MLDDASERAYPFFSQAIPSVPKAIRFAMTKPSEDSESVAIRRSDTSQFVEFEVDARRYAFRIEKIREIVILKDITTTPQVASYVDGVSNLRGEIIPIINLRALFGLSRKPTDDETRTIVVNVGTRTIGCTVDTVTQVLRIADNNIQPAPETIASENATYIHGFAKVDDRLVIVLDVDELLNVEKLHHVHQNYTTSNVSGMKSNGE